MILAAMIAIPSSGVAQQRLLDSLHAELDNATDTTRVNLLSALAYQYTMRGKHKIADSLTDLALPLAEQLNFKRGQAAALSSKATIEANQSNFEKSLKYDFQSLAIYEEIKNKRGVATALGGIGVTYWNQDKYNDALVYLNRALAIYEEIKDTVGVGRVLNNIGLIYWNQGKLTDALSRYEHALKIFEAVGSKRGMSYSLGNIANIYRNQKKHDDALANYTRAMKLQEELGDKRTVGVSLFNIGVVYMNQEKFDSSLVYLSRAQEIATEVKDKTGIGSALRYKGMVYEKQGQLELALTAVSDALRLQEEIGDKGGVAAGLQSISAIYEKRGRYDLALDYAKRSLDVSIEIGNKLSIHRAYEQMSSIYQKMGEAAKALETYKLHVAYKDSLFTAEADKKAAELREQYESAQKQKEIDLLTKENQVRQLESERQRNSFIIGLLFVGFIAVVTGAAYRQSQRAAKALTEKNQLIEQQKKLLEEQKRLVEVQRDDLSEANRLKNDLLAIAAHDLKNPLQSIMGFSGLLRESPTEAGTVAKYSGVIYDASQRMLRLISELLDVAAQDDGTLRLNKHRTNVCELLAAVVTDNLLSAQKKSQTIALRLEETCVAEIDADRMREVFDNLISNAIKYSPTGKTIYVETKKNTKHRSQNRDVNPLLAPDFSILISIRDEGQGLTEDDKKKLFGKFQRLSARPTGGESSTGLGLSIVKHLVELHGGRVWAESAGKDNGSTFFIELPASNDNGD
jgi:signal transduction histidine kinase/Tfp pilus assembly protein PilF